MIKSPSISFLDRSVGPLSFPMGEGPHAGLQKCLRGIVLKDPATFPVIGGHWCLRWATGPEDI